MDEVNDCNLVIGCFQGVVCFVVAKIYSKKLDNCSIMFTFAVQISTFLHYETAFAYYSKYIPDSIQLPTKKDRGSSQMVRRKQHRTWESLNFKNSNLKCHQIIADEKIKLRFRNN